MRQTKCAISLELSLLRVAAMINLVDGVLLVPLAMLVPLMMNLVVPN